MGLKQSSNRCDKYPADIPINAKRAMLFVINTESSIHGMQNRSECIIPLCLPSGLPIVPTLYASLSAFALCETVEFGWSISGIRHPTKAPAARAIISTEDTLFLATRYTPPAAIAPPRMCVAFFTIIAFTFFLL